ncbi:MAG TPA: Asp-tRNA(Asn)/Glu-tRNA(Gln) amidotransferase subunit GatA [Flavisolibacter sp.]
MFHFSSIEQYHASLNSGMTTCVQAVQHYLSAIEQNRHLNAFVEVYAGEALARAESLDSLPPGQRGRLHGVVTGLKDNICYKDHPATASSGILRNFIAVYSATAVERLLQEGAIIIGRQNCDEFGMGSTNEHSVYGPVLNPIDPSLVPGGSSGGSGAAVKAGLCMVSLGSDTGGSVRLPADFCGIVGLKPSYGRVSRHGLLAYASSFDQIGILANSVEDAAAVLEVIQGPDEYDGTTDDRQPIADHRSPMTDEGRAAAGVMENGTHEGIGGPSSVIGHRIAFFPEWLNHPSIDPEIAAAIREQIEKLKAEGHTVEEVPFELTDYIVPTYYILTTAEASSNLSRYDGVRFGAAPAKKNAGLLDFYKENRSHGFGIEVKRRIMLGSFVLSSGYFDAYYTKAQQVRRLLKQQTDLIFSKFDFIIAPTSPTVAYRLGVKDKDPLAMYMGDIFTVFANLTGIPAISLPVFKHSSNASFGLQVMCCQQNEVILLRFSHRLMQQ